MRTQLDRKKQKKQLKQNQNQKTKHRRKQTGGNFHLAKDRIRIYEGNEPELSEEPGHKNENKKTHKKNRPRTRKFKPMQCSPIVDGKTPVRGSCFTRETLEKIKTAYNENHPDYPISAESPEEEWLIMKNRLYYT
jgi:hypothetical protein